MSYHETLELILRPRIVGVTTFTYSVGDMHGTAMRSFAWSPRLDFQARSLADLVLELPGGRDASGLRITFSGPGFSIRGHAYDESDFARLQYEFNDQIDRILVGRGHHALVRDQNVHVQILIIRHDRPPSTWIFNTS
ncbi:hypothetical protein HIM_07745 [Hirsutella minnesotensis 3608]|uniref:Uncharacterized protein n=1 Tax=Hirsutella minnesotensis 3608 TaxID=1043627 RepID=A0A0F7ZHK5_9HYPO|nr:hypothetical protein HIM_07745 [Hirsutella minnesotensis 3608]